MLVKILKLKLKKKIRNAEIIVYDNDSRDKSVEISKKHRVKVVTVIKRGKGNVVRRMFSDDLDAKFFIMIDGDNTYDVSDISKTIKMMKDGTYDMLVAKRIHFDPLAYRKGHIIGNKLFSKFVNLIFTNTINL